MPDILLNVVESDPEIRIMVSPIPSISLQVTESDPEILMRVTPPSIIRVNHSPVAPIVRVTQSPIGQTGLQGPQGETPVYIIGEIPVGDINGVNATFTTEFEFLPLTVQPYVNGLAQKRIEDFNTVGNQTFTLAVSPIVGDDVTVSYQENS